MTAATQISISMKDVPLFQGLFSAELKVVTKCLKETAYKKGEMLFFAGDSCGRIFIVRSGRVKVFRTSSAGREQILEILNPGDTCACNPGSKTWSCVNCAEAQTDCEVWYFSRDRYIELVQKNSQFANTLNKVFAQRLCHLSALIEEVSLKDVRKRLIKFLLDMHDNSVAKVGEMNLIYIPFTREEIARRLGSSRETVARYLHDLKRLKLIDIKPNQIVIRSKESLEKLLL